jgi:CheY-like chemotaxis protein
MPGIDGFEVVERARASGISCEAIIVMLTSSERIANAARCRQHGISHCMIKPIGNTELLGVIQKVLGIAKPAERPEAIPQIVPPSHRSLHILVAEDNPVNQKLAGAMLKKMGHQVTLATDGAEALDKWTRAHFDMIFMDVQMPEMDGFETTRKIRSRESNLQSHIPIVAMTANAMSGDRERCVASGMDDYISKPISRRALTEAIERVAPAANPVWSGVS